MNDEQDKINAAFERFLFAHLSKDARRQIVDSYGERVAAQVDLIFDAALDAPVDWRTATMDSALGVLHDFLDREYSWFSPEARTNINYAFIMTWK